MCLVRGQGAAYGTEAIVAVVKAAAAPQFRWESIMRRLRTAVPPATLIIALACWGEAHAQTLPLGPLPRGVIVERDELPYTVRGNTADQLLAGLRAGGRGNRWYRYRWSFRWTYNYQPVRSLTGVTSTDCRTQKIDLVLKFTSVFPVWERPPEPDPELVEAWEPFDQQIREI